MSRVLVGGVSQLYQGDLDVGRRVVELLAEDGLGDDVAIEDLHYGALAVAQYLQDVEPEVLVLVGAEERGRPPGTVERREVEPPERSPQEAQVAVSDAGTGYVGIDLVIEVAAALDALPARTVAIELEPVRTFPSEELTDAASAAIGEIVGLVRDEVRGA